MRRLRADVSHRMRSRGPSIFSTGWFRILLGAGLAVMLGLAVGPSIAGWFGTDLPKSVLLLSPWSGSGPARPAVSEPAPTEPPSGPPPPDSPRPPATTTPIVGSASPISSAAAPMPTEPVGEAARDQAAVRPSPAGATKVSVPARPAPALSAPAPVYWIQIGAFLDHRNADRLVDRLRAEGLAAATSVFEQSRTLYRVVVVPPEGSAGTVPDAVLDRARNLGFTVEPTDEGPALTGAVPLRAAVDASHRVREQGIQVRLKQEVGSATYRVVRVGSYGTGREAEQALAQLTARGFEGFVVRDR